MTRTRLLAFGVAFLILAWAGSAGIAYGVVELTGGTSSEEGPQGPAGPTGARGIAGSQGPPGPQGQRGLPSLTEFAPLTTIDDRTLGEIELCLEALAYEYRNPESYCP